MTLCLAAIAFGAAGYAAWCVGDRGWWVDAEVRVLAMTTAFFSQLVAVVLFAGFVVQSFAPWLLATTGAGLSAGVVALLPPAPRHDTARVPGRAARGGTDRTRRSPLRPTSWTTWLAVIAVGLASSSAALAFLLPPRGYDTLWYHLPSIAHWLGEGRITTASFSPIIGRYPANVEALWLHVAVFAGSARPLVFVNLALTLQLGLATRALGRLLGLGVRGALVSAALVVMTPVVLAQTGTGHVDAATAAFSATAAAFGTAALRRRIGDAGPAGALPLTLLGASVGLAAGSKASAAVPALALLVLVAVLLRRPDRTGGSPAQSWRGLALATALAAALGAPWYARNLLVDGDPVAPFAVRVAGISVFDGPVDAQSWLSDPPPWIAGWPRPVQLLQGIAYDAAQPLGPHSIAEEEPRGGLGPWFPFVGIPSGLVVLVDVARRRAWRSMTVRTAAVPCGYLVLGALAQPYWWWSRFTLPLVVPAALAVPVVLRAVSMRLQRLLIAGVVLTSVTGAMLGVVHVGYPEEQYSAELPTVLQLIRHEGPLVPYGAVMPNRAALDDLGGGSVGLDDAIEADGRIYPVLIFPLYGISFQRRVFGVPRGLDAAGVRAWDAAHRPVAIAADAGGPLEAVLRSMDEWSESPSRPVRLTIFVRRPR